MPPVPHHQGLPLVVANKGWMYSKRPCASSAPRMHSTTDKNPYVKLLCDITATRVPMKFNEKTASAAPIPTSSISVVIELPKAEYSAADFHAGISISAIHASAMASKTVTLIRYRIRNQPTVNATPRP